VAARLRWLDESSCDPRAWIGEARERASGLYWAEAACGARQWRGAERARTPLATECPCWTRAGEDDANAWARGGGDTRRGGTGLSVNQKEKAVRAQLPLDGPRRTGPAAEQREETKGGKTWRRQLGHDLGRSAGLREAGADLRRKTESDARNREYRPAAGPKRKRERAVTRFCFSFSTSYFKTKFQL